MRSQLFVPRTARSSARDAGHRRYRLIAEFILILFLVGVGTSAVMPPAYAASIVVDSTAKTVTITGDNYQMVLDYDHKAVVSSLEVDGQEMLEDGIYSALYDGSSWTTTLSLSTDPAIAVAGNVLTVTLDTALAHEVWTVTALDDDAQLEIDREYTGAGTFTRTGTPTISLRDGAVENLRWHGDGGNYPVGGVLLNNRVPSGYPWHQGAPTTNANFVSAKEQLGFDLLDSTSSTALGVNAISNHNSVHHEATEVRREPATSGLRLDLMTSSTPLEFATGSVLGYNVSNSAGGGRSRVDGGPVFKPTSVTAGQHDIMTVTFTPKDHDDFYDLGTLEGIDEQALSKAINNYGRWMMQDALRGASNETPILKNELPPLEMHWIGNMISVFNSPAAIAAFQHGLEDIRDHLHRDGGRVGCCYPGLPPVWRGDAYTDNNPGYALGVVKAYELTGDQTWLASMKTSVESALDWATDPANGRIDATTKLALNSETCTSLCNDYWQMSVGAGAYNGYLSIMLYEALTRWSELEADVLGDTVKADQYATLAAQIKISLNTDFDAANPAAGGLWSPTTNSFLYSTGNADAPYLPVQGAALRSGVASTPTRARQIAQSFEDATVTDGGLFHFMNYKHVVNGGPAPRCGTTGQNGGWYPQVDADFYAGLPLLNDREKIPYYINTFTSRYKVDNFFGNAASSFDRADVNIQCGFERWAPLDALPAWGLYTYGYGIQPRHDELVLAPFISRDMVGSEVDYTWRGVPLTFQYAGLAAFTVEAPSVPTPIRVRWINQTPGATYHIRVNGNPLESITADARGNVDRLKTTPGTHTFVCVDCVDSSAPATPAPAGTLEDTDPNLRWSGYNAYSGLDPDTWSNGTAHSSKTTNAYMVVNCPTNCTGFKWHSTMNTNRGLADVYIDDEYQATVDTYAPSLIASSVVYDSGVLPPGGHTMRIKVKGQRNASSTDNWVEIDAVTRSYTTTVDDTDADITYSGMTAFTGLDLTFYDRSTAHSSRTTSQGATYSCTDCTQFIWSGTKGPNRGEADVLIDGDVVDIVDTYASALTLSAPIYSSPVLPAGPHTFAIRVRGTKNAASTNYWVEIDSLSWRSR